MFFISPLTFRLPKQSLGSINVGLTKLWVCVAIQMNGNAHVFYVSLLHVIFQQIVFFTMLSRVLKIVLSKLFLR